MVHLADVLVPPNEEGTRATVLRWCKEVGDAVIKDEPLVELETDKVTVEIPAPANGTLIEILKTANAEVVPDEVLARLSLSGASTTPPDTVLSTATQTSRRSQAPSGPRDPPKPLSPSVRRLLRAHSIAASDIDGTGRDGRVTAQDVTRHVTDAASRVAAATPPGSSPLPWNRAQPGSTQAHLQKPTPGPAPAPGPAQEPQRTSTRIPHTAVRRRVAEHMARSLLEAPHVTTLFEADLTRVLAHRARHAADYESRGARLTLTAYFISACAQALGAHPEVNATFHEDALELHADVNIGVGTALGNRGLIVPVIHRAQGLSLFDIARKLNQVVDAARAGKLAPDDVRRGTFTISNHGVSGSLLAAPIVINQPQVAILGVGRVERRVCAVEVDGVEAISVRSMCYLTLTIDHRALDAFQANAFLTAVVATLEQWPADDL